MRILLLPLTKRQTLLFAQRLTENPLNKPSPWLTWIMRKSQKTWSDWGKSETKWKSKTVATGNKLLDKIDWEEYSLKTIVDPKTTTAEKIPVVHPGFVRGKEVNDIIEELIRRRKPIHQRYRWRWALFIPLTFPFSIVPIVPNLPFFYAAYRCWSHHRALKGGEYLDQLLRSNALVSEPSPILDRIYALKSPPKLTQQDIAFTTLAQELLLSKDKLSQIAKEFNDNDISVLGNRAIVQITKQVKDGIKKREDEQVKKDVTSTEEEVKQDQEGKKRQ